MYNKVVYLPLSALLLAGCLTESEPTASDDNANDVTIQLDEQILDTGRVGVIATASSDYQTSDIAVFSTDAQYNLTITEGNFATTELTDIGISTFGDALYRKGRYQSNNLTRYSLDASLEPSLVWQYSVMGEDSSANPYTLTFQSSSKAYLTRYDSTDLWIVDPSVSDSGLAGFRLGEVDLSAYATEAGGVPRMSDALLVGERLYVLMERLNADYSAVASSYLAVISTTDNREVDTTPGDSTDLSGIELPVRNASNLSYHDGKIYVAGRGDTAFGASDANKYTGGVATVDIDDNYTTELIIDDDGVDASYPYGQIQRVELVDDNLGYFVGRKGWGNDTLYYFNPSNLATIAAVDGLSGVNIADIETLTLSDAEARYSSVLYVAVQAASADDTGEINVINVMDHSIFATFTLDFNPTDIEFMNR